jgi:hypothetical protein
LAFSQSDEDYPSRPGAVPAVPQATVRMAFGQENRDIVLWLFPIASATKQDFSSRCE